MAPETIEELKLIFVTRAECQDTQTEYDGKLHENSIALTEIKTKLNTLMGILSAIGVGVLGIALKLLFP